MQDLPDFERAFDYENSFYLSCDNSRMGKLIAHHELFQMSLDVPGAIVECGVFVGASFMRFAMMRELFGGSHSKKMVGFDTFGEFPEVETADDQKFRDRFFDQTGGAGLSVAQITTALNHKGISKNFELVAGDVVETIPDFVAANPEMRISLLNIDTCTYESCRMILETLYPRVAAGGIVVLDDYAAVEGETRADEDYFRDKDVAIRKFPFARSPCYIVKPNLG